MEQLEYDHNLFVDREADKALAVRFFSLPVKDEEASVAEGRPIFKDVKHVEIRVRGDRNNIVHQPVDEQVKLRFPDAWRAYEQSRELLDNGTPLAEWPIMTSSMVKEMEYFGFYTVEHVAEARDDILSKFPGLRSINQRARQFLELAKGGAPLEALQSKLESVESEKAALQDQVKELASRIAKMEAAASK